MKISKSLSIKKAVYKIDAAVDLEKPVIIVEGNNIVLDFKNAVLQGSNSKKNPDEFFGLAILIRNSKNVTVKNLSARGYKIAILAKNTEGLVLDNCDFSYNYRQHLNSTQEKEDIADWMSYHQNEKDEWLRYGAAIYLRNCNKAEIKNCKVTGGQNALMMTACNDGRIYNNDFSFNSGIGIGMYRSNGNNILYNRLIFNVRGYSHGIYNRGQDSAGILVYEQSSNNVFYKNNVTHGGDGFFLWAGQTTMDSGKGGCNDNLIIANDFSYAPTNGIEVTFSRNKIINNRIYECDHGIWGGYSYQSVINDNKFRSNRIAIAIEHGQENRIAYNIFFRDKEAIRLWARESQPDNWGYAKNNDTRSRGYIIAYNNFNKNETVFNLQRTENLSVFNNIYTEYGELFKTDDFVKGLDTSVNEELEGNLSVEPELSLPTISKPLDPFKNVATFAGRKNILITEWGPYDFRSPLIWNTNPADTSDVMQFDLKGPAGKWKIKKYKGVDSLSGKSGSFPATITAKRVKDKRTDIAIELEYSGEEITTPFGVKIAKGKPSSFTFREFFQPIDWEIRWFSMDTAYYNPVKTGQLFSPVAKMAPIKTERADRVDFALWAGVKVDTISYDQFITVAEGKAEIPKGQYELSVTWDDAVRIYVDEKLVLNEWNPSKYKFDESPNRRVRLNLGGNHSFRVEHLNLGGFSVLSLKLKPVL